MQLLARQGLTAVTMRRVAGRLGVGAMTLYTYINGQRELHREIVRQGFDMLHARCCAGSTLGTAQGWRGGAKAYVTFAVDHPNLYRLMFDTPMAEDDLDLIQGGFSPLLDRVREHLATRGMEGEALDHAACASAGRYWIAMHGLATLAIAGRIALLQGDLDALIDDLLTHVGPPLPSEEVTR